MTRATDLGQPRAERAHDHIRQDLDRVPPEVRDQLRSRLEEIARTLASLPAGSVVWDSLYESGMLLEVGGWRFQYRIDREKQQMIVQAARFSRRLVAIASVRRRRTSSPKRGGGPHPILWSGSYSYAVEPYPHRQRAPRRALVRPRPTRRRLQ